RRRSRGCRTRRRARRARWPFRTRGRPPSASPLREYSDRAREERAPPRGQRCPIERDARSIRELLDPDLDAAAGAAAFDARHGHLDVVVVRVLAPEDPAQPFGRAVVAQGLDDERRPLALAEVVARRLPRCRLVAERAQDVVAELEGDAEGFGERL